MDRKVVIETKQLKKYFPTKEGNLHAVDNVNVKIYEGQTLGVVGESGCGKSTLGRTILNLLPATSGEVLFNGENIVGCSSRKFRELRKSLQIIFQDPYASLNPRMTVSEIISEPIIYNKIAKDENEAYRKTLELMDKVGIAKRLTHSYPHELDGGRRQRIGIARALALNPQFIVCDEPVSALDVSIQAQVLNLLQDLQKDLDLTYMFITHDLSVVRYISDQIAVMYLGQVVEYGNSEEIFNNPLHPYTKALLSAIPSIDIDKPVQREVIRGEISSPINPKPGCRFASRCKNATPACMGEDITLKEVTENHYVQCNLFRN